MATRKPTPAEAPASTPAPSPAPGAGVPVKLSKLAAAMQSVSENVTSIEALSATIAELETKWPANTAFTVSTKAGMKEADEVRAKARKTRLDVQNLKKDGTALLNGLKNEVWAVADPKIATLQAIEDNAKAQIEAQENKEAERVARHEKSIAGITALGDGLDAMSSEELAARRQSMEAIVVDESYEEFEEMAKRKRGEVVDAIAQAHGAAVLREAEKRRQEEVAAAQSAELATMREKQERETRIREKIATIKALPDQAVGSGADNIREILRLHKASVPSAESFGDMLEFAEMAHELTTGKLQTLLDEALASDVVEQRGKETGMGGTQWTEEEQAQLREQDNQPLEPNTITGSEILKRQAALSMPETDGDPFTEPLPAVTATTHTAPAGAIGAPVPRARPVWRGMPPAASPSPAPAEPPPPPSIEEEQPAVPDLLEAARVAIKEYDAMKLWPSSEVPMAVVMKGAFGEAMESLRAAVAFVSEFAN